MSILPTQVARVSLLLQSSLTTQSINGTQAQLQQIENEITTGNRVNVASDDPSSASIIQQLKKTLAARTSYASNVTAQQSTLNETDSTLNDVNSLLQQATSVASANVSTTVTSDDRAAAATTIDSLYTEATTLANKDFEGSYLFGGDSATSAPYVSNSGGMEYTATGQTLANTVDQNSQVTFQVSGASAFGGFSAPAGIATPLNPSVTVDTRLSDLSGTTGNGVESGSIQIGNGTTTATVDLSQASNLGDVINDINAAGLNGVTASLTANGIQLAASSGANITVNDISSGTTAADLGIATATAQGPNVNVVGQNVSAKVTNFTTLGQLNQGAGIDTTGFTIKNGTNSKTISVSSSTTIESLLNQINGDGLGVQAKINPAGAGIEVVNAVQGASLSISENGGTTATDLGIRTFSPATPLANLNGGKGVNNVAGDDFSITTADGSIVKVDLGTSKTVQDALDAINTAAGTKVTASFSTTGNGIVLTDNTTGTATLAVTSLNSSTTAADLGLTTTASAGKITGTDVNGVTVPGIFTDLQNLRDALRRNDTAGITAAAEGLATDTTTVTDLRGSIGSTVQELQTRATQISDENTATQALLSQVQGADMTTTITQYQALQNSLQATLQTSAKTLNMSLLDYIG